MGKAAVFVKKQVETDVFEGQERDGRRRGRKDGGRMEEDGGRTEEKPHGKPRGTVAMRDVECLYERDHRHRR
ncbi:MAG: hypothetical protein PUH68_03470 [Bacteroidales bacterium]|nr:hypothetical protein [Bacteroidales bacterium]